MRISDWSSDVCSSDLHAPWSSDEDDYGDTWKENSTWGDTTLRKVIPLFEKYDVDMVFYGHLHCYERSKPLLGDKIDRDNGIVYVMCGGAGGNLEDFAQIGRASCRERGCHDV